MLDRQIGNIIRGINEIKKLLPLIGKQEEISVSNFDEVHKHLKDELLLHARYIAGIVEKIEIPKELKISNFPEQRDTVKVAEVGEVIKLINDLRAIIAQVEFNPTINVDAPKIPEIKIPEIKLPKIILPKISVPEPKVTVNSEIDLSELLEALEPLKYLSDKPTKPLAVRLSDGKQFIKALKRARDQMVTAFSTSKGMDEDEFKKQFRLSTMASKAVGFKITVAAAGVPQVLGAAACYKVQVSSDTDAGIVLVVGGSNAVRATTNNKNGIILIPGNPPVTIDIDNLSKLWVDAESNGGVLCGVYYQR